MNRPRRLPTNGAHETTRGRLPFAKPGSKLRDRFSQQREREKARRAAVAAVWQRDHGCCRICGQKVWRTIGPAPNTGHVHELIYRSRGGDPGSPAGAVLLCLLCHMDEHEHRLVILSTDANETPLRFRKLRG